jgi:hypothetical protein
MQGLGLSGAFTFNFHRVKMKIVAKSRETSSRDVAFSPLYLRLSPESSDSQEQARNETNVKL